MISGRICLGVALCRQVSLHTTRISVCCGEILNTISCCHQHHVSVFQIQKASHMAFHTVLNSYHGQFLGLGIYSVTSDGDRLLHYILLSRTELEPGSQSSFLEHFRWLYGWCDRQPCFYCNRMEVMPHMWYYRSRGHPWKVIMWFSLCPLSHWNCLISLSIQSTRASNDC